MSIFGLLFGVIKKVVTVIKEIKDNKKGWDPHCDDKKPPKHDPCDNKPKPKDDCGCDDDNYTIPKDGNITKIPLGSDKVYGTAEDEIFIGNKGYDEVAGRQGNDQIYGLGGDDLLAGDAGDDLIYGGDGNDYLLGNRGNDRLYGGNGNDTVFGGEGDDVVYGGCGDDLVSGDEGNDIMWGGDGRDIFLYGRGPGNNAAGHDVIKDFGLRGNNADKIQFNNLGAEFDSYAEVMAVATQTSAGVLFTFDEDRSLLVENVAISQLSSSYFIF